MPFLTRTLPTLQRQERPPRRLRTYSLEGVINGARTFVRRLRGEKTDGPPKGPWTGWQMPFLEYGCGMPPEIR